ncbi:MAG TPA: HlyD family efflux transporter periplasmic adaptor subunit, partial [Thermoanaerobaculia bacterium]|nr:HlyD family efflux transporter periplasmic adaptor subunit [Thermoanaerobaculia bacterium]
LTPGPSPASGRGVKSSRQAVVLGVLAVLLVLSFLPLTGMLASRASEVPVVRAERGLFAVRVPAQGNLRSVRATPVSVPAGVPGPFRIAWLAPDGARVRAGDVVVRFDSTELVKQLADARDDGASSTLKIGKQEVQGRAEIDKLDRDSGLAREELAAARQFQKKDETIYSRHEIIESDIDQDLARDKAEHARGARHTREKLDATELQLLSIERRQAELKRNHAEQGLRALEVTAPHDGVLILKRDHRGEPVRVGDSVWNGQPLADIPDLAEMEAEVFVLEADAGGLAPGKRAAVVLESRPDVVWPAEIRRVDPLAKPRLRGSPVQYFAVTLKLATTDPKAMKPGQRVRATLLLEERKDAIAVPRQAVFEEDGKKIVYLRHGATFAAAEVTLGPASLGRVVIEKGIAPGDEVALIDPTRPGRARDDERDGAGSGGETAPSPGTPGASL